MKRVADDFANILSVYIDCLQGIVENMYKNVISLRFPTRSDFVRLSQSNDLHTIFDSASLWKDVSYFLKLLGEP